MIGQDLFNEQIMILIAALYNPKANDVFVDAALFVAAEPETMLAE